MTDQPKAKNDEFKETVHTFTEELSVTGGQLVERLKELVQKGNIRRLILKDSANGRVLLEVPLTLGVVAGASVLFLAPFLAAAGAIAALVIRVQVVVERYSDPADAEKEKTASVIDITPDAQ